MNLSVRELEVVRAVMELGRVTAAAESLGMTQPAASKMLQMAEERLGLQLFIRRHKRLIPTPEAHALLPGVVSALSALNDIARVAENLRSGRAGELSIATNPALATVLLPDAIEVFRSRWPNASVVLRAYTTLETVNLIANQRADIGLIIGGSADPRTEMRVLRKIRIGCVLPKGHPLASKKALSVADLVDYPIISLGPHQPTGVTIRRLFQESNAPVRLAVETSQSTIACALVRANVGIAVLDGLGLQTASTLGLPVRPLLPQQHLEICVVLARHRTLSRLAQEFLSILDETVRK
jgi:DNA-binding transcriptional LysR family regulator